MNLLDAKQAMIDVAQRLHNKGLLAAADGNISFRLDDRILITPTGVSKAYLKPEEIAELDLNGEVINGKPSSERLMHFAVYKHSAMAKCVVHAHPPTAIAWSIAKPHLKELPSHCMSELILAVGSIPFAPYARPGTRAMGDVLLPFLPQHRVIILSRHGAVAWGETLEEAANGMERLEHTAEILLKAEQLGGITNLPPQEVEALYELRKKLGDKIL